VTTDDEFLLLKLGDAIFSGDGPPSEIAELDTLGTGGYVLSYKMAADLLVEKASAGEMDPDLLFMPIAFLYRHWTELALKSLLKQAGGNATGHDLVELYQKLQNCIRQMGPTGSPAAPQPEDPVENIMHEWSTFDKRGTAFRYSKDLSGKPSLPNLSRVNIAEMAKTMSKLEMEFHGYSGWLSDINRR